MGGLILEGGKVQDVSQVTAAMIVLGGTIGAVMVTTPAGTLLRAVKRMPSIFFSTAETPRVIIDEIIGYATMARKSGIVSLEQQADAVKDPFLRKALNLAVDGTDLQQIRKMMELEITLEEHRVEAEAKVFEAAGGYSPTIGIIGAVLGLIQVMKHLENIEEVGRGIAVAFVATVYGLITANLLYLPTAQKIKAHLHARIQVLEMMLEGVVGIVEGMNPKLIKSKLEAYAPEPAAPAKKKSKSASAAAQPAAAKS
jgi:chemotaxis protein MotA